MHLTASTVADAGPDHRVSRARCRLGLLRHLYGLRNVAACSRKGTAFGDDPVWRAEVRSAFAAFRGLGSLASPAFPASRWWLAGARRPLLDQPSGEVTKTGNR